MAEWKVMTDSGEFGIWFAPDADTAIKRAQEQWDKYGGDPRKYTKAIPNVLTDTEAAFIGAGMADIAGFKR